MNAPHARQCCSISSPRAAPAKKGALASSGTGTGRCDCSVASGGMLAQDRRRMEVEDAAVAARDHDVVPFDLSLAGLAARLNDRLRERREAPHVERRELPAAGVRR